MIVPIFPISVHGMIPHARHDTQIVCQFLGNLFPHGNDAGTQRGGIDFHVVIGRQAIVRLNNVGLDGPGQQLFKKRRPMRKGRRVHASDTMINQ
eukprot:scaffold376_cov156-Amphora_coffeaeformis.AAC.12